jgi:hypothetical protein
VRPKNQMWGSRNGGKQPCVCVCSAGEWYSKITLNYRLEVVVETGGRAPAMRDTRDTVRPPSQGLTHAGMTTFAALDSRLKFRNSTVLLKLAACCILHFRPAGGGQSGHGSQAPKPPSHARPAVPPCASAVRFCPIASAWHPKHPSVTRRTGEAPE